MDSIQQNQKIYIMYHWPCLDGIYSLMNLALVLKTKLCLDNWSFKRLYETLCQYIEQLTNLSPNSLNQQDSMKQEKANKYEDQYDPGFYYANICDQISFIPIKIAHDQSKSFFHFNQTNTDYSQSILILLDYFGGSIRNLQQLSERFKYILVIDHHQSCINHLETTTFDINKKTFQQILKNIYVLLNLEIAATDLSIQFCEDLFQAQLIDLIPKNIHQQLIKFNKHVSDHDLYKQQFFETAPLVAAIFNQKFDLHTGSNQIIFFQLLQMDFNYYYKLGLIHIAERDRQIKLLLPQKKLFKLNGSKCYGVQCQDTSLVNELAAQLAQLSVIDGMNNLGVVYRENRKLKFLSIKVHLRSFNKENYPLFRCDIIAECFGGGGHSSASSFMTNKQKLKTFLLQ